MLLTCHPLMMEYLGRASHAAAALDNPKVTLAHSGKEASWSLWCK